MYPFDVGCCPDAAAAYASTKAPNSCARLCRCCIDETVCIPSAAAIVLQSEGITCRLFLLYEAVDLLSTGLLHSEKHALPDHPPCCKVLAKHAASEDIMQESKIVKYTSDSLAYGRVITKLANI